MVDLSDIAADIGAAVDDARRRDQRLLDAAVIAEWVARLDPAAVGAGLTACGWPNKGMPVLRRDEELDFLRRQVLTSRNVPRAGRLWIRS
jgi:hypothetical protein